MPVAIAIMFVAGGCGSLVESTSPTTIGDGGAEATSACANWPECEPGEPHDPADTEPSPATAAVTTTVTPESTNGSSTGIDTTTAPPAPTRADTTAMSTTVASTTASTATMSPTTTAPSSTTTATTATLSGGPVSVDAAAYAVFDATADRWLGEYEADTPLAVGSVIKLLTAYTVLQAGELDRRVTVPQVALEGPADESRIWLYKGQQLPRDALLRATLIVSANDAARSLAIDIAGSEPSFVDLMNAAAGSLGLDSTVAANATGLDAAGASSTARDVTRLAAVLLDEPLVREAVVRRDAEMFGQLFPATNLAFLESYPGAAGVKTGHTSGAGYCLVAAAERDGRLLIAAVLGTPTSNARVEAATALLDWGFAQP